jgi:hypothetical protein
MCCATTVFTASLLIITDAELRKLVGGAAQLHQGERTDEVERLL